MFISDRNRNQLWLIGATTLLTFRVRLVGVVIQPPIMRMVAIQCNLLGMGAFKFVKVRQSHIV